MVLAPWEAWPENIATLAARKIPTGSTPWCSKIKEAFLAIRIEQLLNKDEILELYLNKIYLGYRAYGVGAAAQVYFGKPIDQLTLSAQGFHLYSATARCGWPERPL